MASVFCRISRKMCNASYLCRKLSCERDVMTTAGILVIGDEILKGEVLDTNSPCIVKTLHDLGVKVKKICVIGDEVDTISNEVRRFSRLYTYVISTGGIGPTHDDVTFEAVAKAFGISLCLHPELRRMVENFYQTCDLNHPGMKLARVPEGANLCFSDDVSYPNVSVKNVYLFPGIPELFQRSFCVLAPKLFFCPSTFYQTSIYLNVPEHAVADQLDNLASECPCVQIGSYPKLFDDYYKVRITLESTDETLLKSATKKLLQILPMEYIVTIKNK